MENKWKGKITRLQAIKLILTATYQDDPYWADLVEDYYDEESDTMPTIFDMLEPLNITKEDIKQAEKLNV